MSATNRFQLIIGEAGDPYFFREEIFRRARAAGVIRYDFLYLLPVKRAVRYFKGELISAAPQRVAVDPPVFTFYQFIINLYNRLPQARKVISPAMRLFLVEEVLKKTHERLNFFTTNSIKRMGLVRKVDALLTELREYGYNPENLLENLPEHDERTEDFALLIGEFERALGKDLIDESGAIQDVIARLDEDFWKRMLPEVKVVYLNGYGLFSRPMIEFVRRVCRFCDVHIKLDYWEKMPELFAHVDPAYQELQKLNPQIRYHGAPHTWEKTLFNKKAGGSPLQALAADVLIQPAGSRSEEVAFIAAYVKRLHRQHKIPLHKIGITFSSLELYAPLIHEIFPRYGLPYNLSTGFPLSHSPLIRSFLLLLEVPLLYYQRNKLLQLISSPFYQHSDTTPQDVDAIKAIARVLRLTHFHAHWQPALDRHLQHLEAMIDESQVDEDIDLQTLQRDRERLQHGRGQLEKLMPALHKLEIRQTVQQFRRQYLELLKEFGFLDWYTLEKSSLTPAEKEQEYRAFNRFIKILDQFSWIVSALHGEQPLSLKDFHQYLSLLVSQATYNLREWPQYGLQIMPRLEILATCPQVLVFGGMIEGEFPRPFTQDVFFHDQQRESLGLVATEDLTAQDRYLFYQVIRSTARRIIFSYPRFLKSSTTVPSNFLTSLSESCTVRWRRSLPSPAFLRTTRDLLEQAARSIPAGITATAATAATGQLRRWLSNSRASDAHRRAAVVWLQRVLDERGRRRRDGFSELEGMLSEHPEIRTELAKKYSGRAFSITRLETFAFCPIKFFFLYLIAINEEEEPEAGLTALERGQYVHQVLFRFYSELRKRGATDRPWMFEKLLMEIATEEFQKFPMEGLFFEAEKERYFGTAGWPGLWRAFLSCEQEEISRLGFSPQFFEVAFGQAGRRRERDPASHSQPITLTRDGESVQVIGKIDRVDINDAGQAILLDYKTGAGFDELKDICRGTALQLPVYAAVLPELLSAEASLQSVMAAVYQVRDEANCGRKPVFYDGRTPLAALYSTSQAAVPNSKIVGDDGQPLDFQGVIDLAVANVFRYVQEIQAGEFHHTLHPRDRACSHYCQFRLMCRKDVQKLLHLSKESPEGDQDG